MFDIALERVYLTLSWRRSLSYRNQSIDLQGKSMDWFIHDNGFRHKRVKADSPLFPTVISQEQYWQNPVFEFFFLIYLLYWSFLTHESWK